MIGWALEVPAVAAESTDMDGGKLIESANWYILAAVCAGGALISLLTFSSNTELIWPAWNADATASVVGGGRRLEIFSCSLRWALIFSGLANARSQRSHLKGFSPVCVKRWRLRYLDEAYPLPHFSQMYGFSPVWFLSCTINSLFLWYGLPQCLHLNTKPIHYNLSMATCYRLDR